MRYNVSLLNTDPTLDLRLETNNINEAKELIETGGVDGNKYNNVISITILNITKRNILMDVIELNKNWHMHLGHELANHFNMRRFCYKDVNTNNSNNEIMFEWH